MNDSVTQKGTMPIYLDYNGTTPILREVADAMLPYLYEDFGNPSSSHPFGSRPREASEAARVQIAGLLGCRPEEILFTSGGTGSNNHAIRGAALARREHGNHIITSAIEHPAVIEVCQWLQTQGFRITVLPVDETGSVSPVQLESAMTAGTTLVTIMHANNEVGTVQSIAQLADIAHQHGALMHTDAAQSVGKIPVQVDELGVDLLTIAGHKLYAPKGLGALYVREGVRLTNLMFGAGQETGRRPGTENVPYMVGLGHACALARRDLVRNQTHFSVMRGRLYSGLQQALGDSAVRRNGHVQHALPNTLSLSFRNVEANTLLAMIGDQVAASAGAACHADSVTISAVLQAMAVPLEWAKGTVRFSVGRGTTAGDVETAVQVITRAVLQLSKGV